MALDPAADLPTFFDTDEFAVAAIYTPASGSPVSLTVIVDHVDAETVMFDTNARRVGIKIHARRDQLATKPAEGGTITIGAQGYKIRYAAEDPDGLTWRIDVDEAA